MRATIFNRADFEHPSDGWYQIEPKGTHPNLEAGVDQVIDDAACAAIVNRFNADADAGRLPQGHELLIDHEHFKDQADKETVAYGWLTKLTNRADGIYGQIRWTAIGQSAVDGGDYRFFSSEYDPKDVVVLGGTPPKIRPMRLDGLTLTNMPNNKGGKPITNRAIRPGNGAPSDTSSKAAQERAAQRVAQLALAECRSSGVSLCRAWERVLNRNVGLADMARGRTVSTGGKIEAREVVEDAAGFAGRAVLRLAQSREMPGMAANLRYVRNRFPRLARMENREGWDVLKELEPEAHKTYMDAAQQPRGDAQPESRWNGFFEMVDAVKQEIPDLGYEGVWQKLRELYPATFLKFVLSFDDQEGSSDLLAPAPKTEEERYREKRARITLAANTEFKRYGRNGRGPQKMAENTVSEALAAL